jgi:hypothetical protein
MAALILKYRTGEEIKKGDRVLFHRNPAEVELVASDATDPDPEIAWHMKEHGRGVLIREPDGVGSNFYPCGFACGVRGFGIRFS